MKTIEVTDEMYDRLIDLSKKMNTQSHRATAMPYFFQVQDTERIYGIDCRFDNNGFVWVRDELEIEPNRAEMIEQLMEDEYIFSTDISDDDLDNLMEDAKYEKVYYRNQQVYSNAFLTEDACKNHIQRNRHHYNAPTDFLTHGFRNPELELVQQFLCELSGGKLHK